jgi:hypothetical protein
VKKIIVAKINQISDTFDSTTPTPLTVQTSRIASAHLTAPIPPISLDVPVQLTVHAPQTTSLNPVTQMTPRMPAPLVHTPTIRCRNGHDAIKRRLIHGTGIRGDNGFVAVTKRGPQ